VPEEEVVSFCVVAAEPARARAAFPPEVEIVAPDLVGVRSMESKLCESSIGFMMVSRLEVVKLGEGTVTVGTAERSNVKASVGREGEDEKE
jgi:hypothetical protein